MSFGSNNDSDDVAGVVTTDLMSVLTLVFLLALGVGLLLAGGLAVTAQSLSIDATLSELVVQEQRERLQQLVAAERAQRVLSAAWSERETELIAETENYAAGEVFLRDRQGMGVQLANDIIQFQSGRPEPEVDAARLDEARRRLCAALQLFRDTALQNEAYDVERLGSNPFEYLEIVVEGHADAMPLVSRVAGSNSNWALSSNRASQVLQRLVVPEDLYLEHPELRSVDQSSVCLESVTEFDNSLSTSRLFCDQNCLLSRHIRIVAAGRGSMQSECMFRSDLTPSERNAACEHDRFAVLRVFVRTDRLLEAFRQD